MLNSVSEDNRDLSKVYYTGGCSEWGENHSFGGFQGTAKWENYQDIQWDASIHEIYFTAKGFGRTESIQALHC